MPFVDKCRLLIKAGDGGDGIVSWRREAHVPLGGPAGGNGGNGGNIYFIGDHNETSLETLNYYKKIIAKNGENGGIKNMYGANAEDLIVKVPLGTVVINDDTNKIIADITLENQKYLIASGGLGGHGNAHFKSGFNKAPTLYEKGELGETFNARLELKELADVGLIGLPNAGKSTLISKLTNATPKIANYQFTTLVPILGSFDYNDQKIIIADIPGLIEDASEGVGLGHEFLKHIERCKILLHVVSLSLDDNEDIIASVNTIFNELKKYNLDLIKKKIIIIANKLDLEIENYQLNKLREMFSNYEIIPISCTTGEGIEKLKEIIYNEYLKIKLTQESVIDNTIIKEFTRHKNKDEELSKSIEIVKINDHTYDIKCEYLKYWSHRIPINTPDNLIRFNQKMKSTNLFNELREIGANIGDVIKIYGIELEYEE
ncbi:MAG: GTPase ObgE [Candidatus Ureaplasma intestinipullorum]|uniref:GTPase Obg n=1 Tax=Candidatus Ureaplasma intestinipullorum TaxID=2838770 RepID=A0A9E2NXS3_9BACT|nr:GTPase ObgE [Candidatus Ureaplasma intestinipullorum]